MAGSLAGPGAGTFEKIASVGLPVLAGVAAAAHPAGARGLAGLTSAMGLQLAARKQERDEYNETQLGQRLSGLLDRPGTPAIPGTIDRAGALDLEQNPEAAGSPAPMTPGTPAGPRMSDIFGPQQTALIRTFAESPGGAKTAAGLISKQLDPRALTVVGEGGVAIDPRTGKVIARGDPRSRGPVTVSPGQTVLDPVTQQPIYSMPDRPRPPMALSPGQKLVNPEGGEEITSVPDRPISMAPGHGLVNPNTGEVTGSMADRPVAISPGQKLVNPRTGDVTASMPERPVIVAPGSSMIDPTTNQVVFKAPDRPLTLAPGGALVDPQSGKTIVKMPESPDKPKAGLLVDEVVDGKPRQVLIDPVTGTRRQEFAGKPQATKASDVNSIRGQFLQQSKDTSEIIGAYNRLQSVAKNQSPAADASMIFAFYKMIDPGSVVREAEFATAQGLTGVPGRLQQMYQRAKTGDLLPPALRQDIITQANAMATAQAGQHARLETEYKRIAESQGFDPTQVVPDLLGPARGLTTQGAAPQAGRAATDVEFAKARRDAKGDPKRTIEILIEQGIDPQLDVVKPKKR